MTDSTKSIIKSMKQILPPQQIKTTICWGGKIVFIGVVKFSLYTLEKLMDLDVNLVGVCTKKSSSFNSDFVDLMPTCVANLIPCFICE